MKALSIGMMVCDTLIAPVPSNILSLDSVAIHKPQMCCGGDALNVAMGLARLECPVSIIGRIGQDANGNFILNECEQKKIDTSDVVFDNECGTAASYALIDSDGERHFLTEKSSFYRIEGKDVPNHAIENADIVYIGSAMALKKMDEGGISDVFSRAHRFGKTTVMDAAVNIEDADKDWMTLLDTAFQETDVFFPSMNEAKVLTGESEPEKIAEYFEKYPMKLFGIKLGSKGCFVTDFEKSLYIKCPTDISVVDTTGAGDSFMAGLTCALMSGWDKFEAVKFASCVATKNVGAIGGTAGIPTFSEAVRYYESWKEKL